MNILLKNNIDLVILAGFLSKIGTQTIQKYNHRVLNIHPADPKTFGGKGMYGIHVHQAVLASGEKNTYPTVHYVDEEYDHGNILLSKKVPVLAEDTAESLATRVLIAEHSLYPAAIKKVIKSFPSNYAK